jgi:hypothetical protein
MLIAQVLGFTRPAHANVCATTVALAKVRFGKLPATSAQFSIRAVCAIQIARDPAPTP